MAGTNQCEGRRQSIARLNITTRACLVDAAVSGPKPAD
jgi:hypothetical protein